jgi:murein DD-endopeptidase MepM/ murein hydrolase activator NlpD
LTASTSRIRTALAITLAALLLASVPVRADTAGELRAARARFDVVQGELRSVSAHYAAALSRYADTQAQIETLGVRINRVRQRRAQIKLLMASRFRTLFETGASDTIQLLLTADSFAQFSDRVQFLGRVTEGDTEMVFESQTISEELRRTGQDLGRLQRQQAGTVASLASEKARIDRLFAEQSSLVSKLRSQLASERSALAAAAARVVGGGALKACPVGEPRTFSDDFGQPRYGGGFHYHQGIDILAPLGTPVYAAQSGRLSLSTNDLGGITANVSSDSGDRTYYAHMSSYAGVPNGARVSAGMEIGHVGNSGDALGGPYHLHFEYHPGGGSAVDPYRLLVAVCG